MSLDKLLDEAVGLHKAGQLEDARQRYQQILQQDPQHVNAMHLLGVAMHQAGHHPEAVQLIQGAIRLQPQSPVFYANLGSCLVSLKRFKEAEEAYRVSLTYDVDNADAFNGLGQALLETNPGEAQAAFQKSLELRPQFAEAHYNLANLLRGQGQIRAAVDHYLAAIKAKNQFFNAHHRLGTLLIGLGSLEAAIHHLQHAVRLAPNNARAYYSLGAAYNAVQGRVEDAYKCLRRTIELDPEMALAHASLATTQISRGDFAEAPQSCKRALELDPANAMAYATLCELAGHKHYEFTDEDLAKVRDLLSQELPLDDAAVLNSTVAIVLERRGEYDEAFRHFEQFNSLRKQSFQKSGVTYDPADQEQLLQRHVKVFDKAYFDARQGYGNPTELPIFIVGMPRSGSTLVEQILGAHADVFPAGERRDTSALIQQLMANHGDYPELAQRIDQANSASIAENYRKHLQDLAPDKTRVVDKAVNNFYHLGLIATLFPNARVIHCRRNPLDTCLSCFFQNFRSVVFAADIAHIADYYKKYVRMMEHWRANLPLKMLEVDYEDLVANTDAGIRRLIEFAGLSWDDSLLNFHERVDSVQTASRLQVRKPVYNTSVERWRRYENNIGKLRELLEV